MLLGFSILTLIYFLIRLFVTDKFAKRNNVNIMKWASLFLYLGLTITLQVAETSKYIANVCGKANTSKAILYTIIPNVLIFGSLVAILIGFPGWKAPFSNTLGYLCVKGSPPDSGISADFNTLMKSNIDNDLMEKIIEDKSLIINEITPGNFDAFIAKMYENNLLNVSYDKLIELEGASEVKDTRMQEYLDAFSRLYRAVALKDLVAEISWYFLTGILVISMIKNSVAEIECEKSKSDMVSKYKNNRGTVSDMENISDN